MEDLIVEIDRYVKRLRDHDVLSSSESIEFVCKLRKIIDRQYKTIEKLRRKLKPRETSDKSVQTERSDHGRPEGIYQKGEEKERDGERDGTALVESITEAATRAMHTTGFVYEETSGLYYDYTTGYYYNAEYGLYYDGNTGTYMRYDQEKGVYEFHSRVDSNDDDMERRSRSGRDVEEKSTDKFRTSMIVRKSDVNAGLGVVAESLTRNHQDRIERKRKKRRHSKEAGGGHRSQGEEGEYEEYVKDDDDGERETNDKSGGGRNRQKRIVDDEKHREKRNLGANDDDDELEEGECSDEDDDDDRQDEEEDVRNFNGDVKEEEEEPPPKRKEEDEVNESEQYPITDDTDVPCMRIIVKETDVEELRVGSLYVVTIDGGTVGREGSDHTILINDLNVSKHHLRFVYDRKRRGYDVIDTGSRNGTRLNGNRLSPSRRESEPQEIAHGSRIELGGGTVLLCHVHRAYQTCGHCEPGLLLIDDGDNEKKMKDVRRVHDKSTMHKTELKSLRKKFGLCDERRRQSSCLNLGDGYVDRAQVRRDTVGGTDHNEKTEIASVDESIKSSNKGFLMLTKMGWNCGESLGKDNATGIKEPINQTGNVGTTGLGSSLTQPELNRPQRRQQHGDVPRRDNRVKDKSKSAINWSKAQERYMKIDDTNC